MTDCWCCKECKIKFVWRRQYNVKIFIECKIDDDDVLVVEEVKKKKKK